MKALIVYDSVYGNTEVVARRVASALAGEVRLMRATDIEAIDTDGLDLLVVGSPTHGGRPTPTVKALLDRIATGSLRGIDVAAFDTRVRVVGRNVVLGMLMNVIGYAAPRINRTLKAKGGHIAGAPEGFIVDGKEGPLRAGEEARAEAWALGLRQSDAAAVRTA